MLDDHNRFVVNHGLFKSATAEAVFEVLKGTMAKHGLPQEILTDNGPQFVTWKGVTCFEKLHAQVNALGIFHLNSPYYYTPFNGKVERVIGELRRYLKFQPLAATVAELEAQIKAWVYEHNYLRCHESLDWLTPAAVFLEKKTPALPDHIEHLMFARKKDAWS